MFGKIRDNVRSFQIGIKNIIKWFPIIWKDRDYDHAYIECMLLHKLKMMYDRFIDPNETYVNWDTDHGKKALKALKICITILERRRSEFYILNLWDEKNVDLTEELMAKLLSVERRDWKLFHKLMEQYMEWWWD
jgi:hypothetical protein